MSRQLLNLVIWLHFFYPYYIVCLHLVVIDIIILNYPNFLDEILSLSILDYLL